MNPMPLLHQILATGLLLVATQAQAARDLGVLVSGFAKVEGEVICRLYSGGRGFPQDEGDVLQTVRYAVESELVTCTFPAVEAGRYAVSVMHDENGNGRFDRNLMGFAKEPWGVSNNVRPQRRAPQFGEASIHVNDGQVAHIEVRLGR